jgi:hypothetical protein
MSFLQNLFGTISGTSVYSRVNTGIGFIPKDGNGGTIEIKGQNVQWLGLRSREMQKWAYDYCFPLASVVDRLAEADLTGELEILRKGGKGKDDYATSPYAQRLKKLFANPNPLQSYEQFRGQQIVYKKIFGFCPVLPVMPAGMESFYDKSFAVALINLPPWLFDVSGTKAMIGQSTIEGLVKEYKVTILNKEIKFRPDQLFILDDGFMQDENCDFLLPKSKLIGLDFAISNICAAMEADNVLLKKRGPLGFISHDAGAVKDSVAGYLPMTQKEKDEVQLALTQYGLTWSQYQYAISRTAVKWNPMSYDVNQLGTKDTVIAGEKAICHRYGYSYILYEDSGATFSNQNGAHKALYQNNVIPNSKRDMNTYNQFFQTSDNNVVITLDYSDLPILQENEKEKADAIMALNNALKLEYENNLITRNQWLTSRGYDTIEGGDVYRKDEQTVSADQSVNPGSGQTGDQTDSVSGSDATQNQ